MGLAACAEIEVLGRKVIAVQRWPRGSSRKRTCSGDFEVLDERKSYADVIWLAVSLTGVSRL